MKATHTNALQRMRLARRPIPRPEDRTRASALPLLGAGARAARFAFEVLHRYVNPPRPLSPEQMVYPAPPSARPGSLHRVFHEHRHHVSLALRLSPALVRWPATPAPGARNGSRHASEPGGVAVSDRLTPQEVGPPRTLLRLAGAGPGFDAEGLPARRVRTTVGHGSSRAADGEPGEDLSPVEIARVVREQGSLALAAANPDLLQSLARRAERIPMVASPPGAVRQASGPPAGTPGPATGAAAVPRVVHRPTPAPVEPDDDSPARGPVRENHARPAPWADLSPGGPQATLDPAHLHRLADQVVRVIDHRMVATRERMGRMGP